MKMIKDRCKSHRSFVIIRATFLGKEPVCMNIVQTLKNLSNTLIDILYPPRCVVCDEILDRGEKGVHYKCLDKLIPVTTPVCMHCGSPVQGRVEFCYDCSRKQKKMDKTFKQGKALFVYKGSIKETMYRFKYSNKREYADYFAEYAVEKYADWIKMKKIEAIVAVPMYKGKQRKRGYNQAETFAKALSKVTGIPYIKNGVKRIKNTTPMKNLDDKERERNLKKAFQTNKNIVQYYYILLVDDIYTTGSTADAVTDTLLRAGVKEIYNLSICIGQGY